MRLVLQIFLLIGLWACPAFAAPESFKEIKTLSLKKEFRTKKDWHVSAFQPEADIAARLCFWFDKTKKQEKCTPITSTLPDRDMVYNYQTVKILSVISSPHLIQFIAEYSGGGSGTLNQVSFWRYDSNIDSFAQAGLVTLTEQSEYKLLGNDMLITADAHWGEGETHFSPHHFTITAYQYSPIVGYKKSFSYLSTAKYPSLDDVDKVDVISHEIAEIKKRLSDVR